jgi:hypothetical protein
LLVLLVGWCCQLPLMQTPRRARRRWRGIHGRPLHRRLRRGPGKRMRAPLRRRLPALGVGGQAAVSRCLVSPGRRAALAQLLLGERPMGGIRHVACRSNLGALCAITGNLGNCETPPRSRAAGAAISRTRRHAERDHPDQEVTPDPPGPPAAAVAWPDVTSLAGGHSGPRVLEQSRVPVTAALTLTPGPARSYPGPLARPWAPVSWKSWLPKLYVGRCPADVGACRDQVGASLRGPG